MNKSDKTKNSVTISLIEMLRTQPLDLITIKDLCARAHVGRTAFYHNFRNKEDVLKYIYRKAHAEVFHDKFKDIDYLYSDNFIRDMILFFDKNSDLLFIIFKWNLINMIARYNTEMSLEYIRQYDDDIIRKYADYFVCYLGGHIFQLCTLWLLNDKNITADELFHVIKYFKNYPTSTHF